MSPLRKAPAARLLTPGESIALAMVIHKGVASDLAIGRELAQRWHNGERNDGERRARGRRIARQLVERQELDEAPRADARQGHLYTLPGGAA